MGQPPRIGALVPADRERVAEILDATRVFSGAEVAVALELFDEAFPPNAAVRAVSGGDGREIGDRPSATGARAPSAGATAHRLPPTACSYSFLGVFGADDALVGYACYGPTPDTDRTFDLYWIAVDPGAQGAGSGTRLLADVERRLEERHARMLVVETSSRSEYAPTRHFYEKRGYVEAARVREFYAPLDDRIIFTKRFHSPRGRGAVQQ